MEKPPPDSNNDSEPAESKPSIWSHKIPLPRHITVKWVVLISIPTLTAAGIVGYSAYPIFENLAKLDTLTVSDKQIQALTESIDDISSKITKNHDELSKTIESNKIEARDLTKKLSVLVRSNKVDIRELNAQISSADPNYWHQKPKLDLDESGAGTSTEELLDVYQSNRSGQNSNGNSSTIGISRGRVIGLDAGKANDAHNEYKASWRVADVVNSATNDKISLQALAGAKAAANAYYIGAPKISAKLQYRFTVGGVSPLKLNRTASEAGVSAQLEGCLPAISGSHEYLIDSLDEANQLALCEEKNDEIEKRIAKPLHCRKTISTEEWLPLSLVKVEVECKLP